MRFASLNPVARRVKTPVRDFHSPAFLAPVRTGILRDWEPAATVIDWLMELPQPLPVAFWEELDEYEEGKTMPYVTSIEREGMFKIIKGGLLAKFGDEAAELLPAIHELNDAEKYVGLYRLIVTATTLDEVRRACAKPAALAGKRSSSNPITVQHDVRSRRKPEEKSMSTAAPPVSDMLVTVKAREIQRALLAEKSGDRAAAQVHFLAAAHLELVLARDYEAVGDDVAVYRSRLSSASCLWRGGEIEKGRRALDELQVQHPDRAPAIHQVIVELSRDYPSAP